MLWSWAVRKGPSLDPADKHIAAHVEDHPIDYADFQGTIPDGQYGAGTVETWDRGTWEPVNDPDQGMRKGELTFILHGKRLNGRFHLVRLKPRPGRAARPTTGCCSRATTRRTRRRRSRRDRTATPPRQPHRQRASWQIRQSEIRLQPRTPPRPVRDAASCPAASRPSSAPSPTNRPQATTGSARSSSTATACSPGSTTARSAWLPATAMTGPTACPPWPRRSAS